MKSKIKVLQVIPKLGYGGAESGCYGLASCDVCKPDGLNRQNSFFVRDKWDGSGKFVSVDERLKQGCR